MAMRHVLQRAGLGHQRDVVPTSIRAWAGWKVFEASGRIEEAAKALGLRSLDSAATQIGHDWLAEP
jgi:integrase/recombinase XerC